jgi:hypothetical protein
VTEVEFQELADRLLEAAGMTPPPRMPKPDYSVLEAFDQLSLRHDPYAPLMKSLCEGHYLILEQMSFLTQAVWQATRHNLALIAVLLEQTERVDYLEARLWRLLYPASAPPETAEAVGYFSALFADLDRSPQYSEQDPEQDPEQGPG